MREVLGDRADSVAGLLRASAAQTLCAAAAERSALETRLAGERGDRAAAHADRLLAISVLEETVAWAASGPIAGLPEEDCPLAIRTRSGRVPRATATALCDVGSTVVLAGDVRTVLPPLKAGEHADVALPEGTAPLGTVSVVRDERRWTLALR